MKSPRYEKCTTPPPSHFVVISERGGPIRPDMIARIVQRAVEAAATGGLLLTIQSRLAPFEEQDAAQHHPVEGSLSLAIVGHLTIL
jgi:hypothetical protein